MYCIGVAPHFPFPPPVQPWTEPGGRDRTTHELQAGASVYATRQDAYSETQSFTRTVEHEDQTVRWREGVVRGYIDTQPHTSSHHQHRGARGPDGALAREEGSRV